MRTIEIFDFKELSKEAKNNAITNYIEKYRENIQNDRNLFFNEDLHYLLEQEESLFTDAQFSYSLSYCQGDGLSFTFDLDIMDYLLKYFPNMKNSLVNVISEYCLFESKSNHRYSYSHKGQVDLYLDYSECSNYYNLEDVIKKVLEHIEDRYMEVCSNLEALGYINIYHWENDKDYIIELIESKEITFFNNGTITNMFNEN